MNTQIDERRGATSASNAEADLLCPGRHLAQRGLLSQESADAAFGTAIHDALARRNGDGLTLEQASIFESCQKIELAKVREFLPGIADKDLRSWPETRFWTMFQYEDPAAPPNQRARMLEHSAQPDRVYRHGLRLLILDYKTLAGDVSESPRNLQVRDQAVVCSGHFLSDEVGVVVIQPLVTHNPEIVLYRKADLQRAKSELFARVLASNDPRSVRVAGAVQCKFCLARHKCLEHQRWAGSMVPQMLNLLDVPVSAWTPEQRGSFCDRFSVAQKWLNDCWDAMEAGAQKDPGFVTGYRLEPGNERKEINNPQAVFERFSKQGGNADAFLGCTKVTMTRLKEALSNLSSPPVRGKKLEDAFKELINGHVDVKRNKDSLKKVI